MVNSDMNRLAGGGLCANHNTVHYQTDCRNGVKALGFLSNCAHSKTAYRVQSSQEVLFILDFAAIEVLISLRSVSGTFFSDL